MNNQEIIGHGLNEVRKVYIPNSQCHAGIDGVYIKLKWICPVCGKNRGDVFVGLSFDGSRKLNVHRWSNPCGHIDKYSSVLQEAKTNGLNDE